MAESANRGIEYRILQVFLGSVALVPVSLGGFLTATGLTGFYLAFGLGEPPPILPTLDSAIRFLTAQFFGMGLIMLWLVPRVERHPTLLRIIVGAIALGASSRLYSAFAVGKPNAMTIALIGVEYSALLMLVLQHRVMKRIRSEAGRA